MQLQDSVIAFEYALLADGHSHHSVDVYTNSLIIHANMCRTRADLPPSAFRDFVTKASHMTRSSRVMLDIQYHDEATARAACEALHDLIMEGV